MTEFEVTVSGEVDEDELIADVIYRGRGVADVRHVEDRWVVTLYLPRQFGSICTSIPGISSSASGSARAS